MTIAARACQHVQPLFIEVSVKGTRRSAPTRLYKSAVNRESILTRRSTAQCGSAGRGQPIGPGLAPVVPLSAPEPRAMFADNPVGEVRPTDRPLDYLIRACSAAPIFGPRADVHDAVAGKPLHEAPIIVADSAGMAAKLDRPIYSHGNSASVALTLPASWLAAKPMSISRATDWRKPLLVMLPKPVRSPSAWRSIDCG